MYRHNQKVWVITADGSRRPARTVTKVRHDRMGYSAGVMPVWYVRGYGFDGWDHAVSISIENLQERN